MSLWVTEGEVVRLMDMKGAIAALDRGLALEAAGKAENMVKTHAIWGGHHTLHAIGATFADEGFVGTKTWAHANGAAPLLILFDSHNGSLRAIIEAFALGQLRTGAISGLATKYLAAEGASDMALIGTGKQAMTQLAAVAAVRPLRRVRAFSRDGAGRSDFVARARKALGQNFLLDLNLARKIARAAGPLEHTVVYEVGPGPGGLTRALLAEGAARVIAIERDRRCIPALEEIAHAHPGRVEIAFEDAIAVNERKLLAKYDAAASIRVAANLPYNLSTALLVKWLTPTGQIRSSGCSSSGSV